VVPRDPERQTTFEKQTTFGRRRLLKEEDF